MSGKQFRKNFEKQYYFKDLMVMYNINYFIV